jgi:transcriptional/translational regulatory protein YebC/TACO1
MTKNGGNMGESGSVGYMFEKKGLFLLEVDKEKTDEQELQIIECGAEDLKQEDDKIEVYTAPDEFFEVKQKLESLGMQILESKLTLICNNYVEINDVETAQKVLNLIEKLEEDDDVMEVIANFDISQEIVDQIE